MEEREGEMRKYHLILIACLSVAAGQCWADEEQAQRPLTRPYSAIWRERLTLRELWRRTEFASAPRTRIT